MTPTMPGSLASFRARVLAAVRRIPRGRVATYGDIAELVGAPGAARAVGNVMRGCSDPSVPCHRVIAAAGALGGFGGYLDRKRQLDSTIKIARHPIRAGKKNPRLPAILKIKDPAVLEKTPNNADDADVFAEIWNFRTQATDSAHDQINGHICARRLIELLDDLLIDERIHLRNDPGRLACECVIALSLDQFREPAMHIERRDQ